MLVVKYTFLPWLDEQVYRESPFSLEEAGIKFLLSGLHFRLLLIASSPSTWMVTREETELWQALSQPCL
jgi:hypothetical protein